jgi:hypothetical protein
MEQTECSCISNGILKREWGVRLPGSKRDAIPEEATAKAIFPLDLTSFSNVFQRNVFPVPPKP